MLANTGKVATIEAMSEFLIEHDVSGDQSELDHVFSASSEELPERPEKTAHVGRQAVKKTVAPMGDWHERANCLGIDTELFFQDSGPVPLYIKKVCDDCSVSMDCLEEGLREDVQWGVRAGMGAKQRQTMKNPRR